MLADLDRKFLKQLRGFSFGNTSRDSGVSNPPLLRQTVTAKRVISGLVNRYKMGQDGKLDHRQSAIIIETGTSTLLS